MKDYQHVCPSCGTKFSDDVERFWSKVAKAAPEECWEWTATASKQPGYFVIYWQGRKISVTRMAWEIAHGIAVPAGLVVMHTCDNPRCVNPTHLEAATQKANIQDMIRKGRAPFQGHIGEANAQFRFTDAQVEAMKRRRSEGALLREISAEFGVSIAHAHRVTTGAARAHAPKPEGD